MTIVLPADYHLKTELERLRISCIDDERARREDIRALRIGICNIMPQAEKYEFSLLYPLGRSIMQIEPIWIRLRNHSYKSSDKKHLDRLYLSFDDVIRTGALDGLIVTGAPVEEIPFESIVYWDEIKEILGYARENIASTLGICWGGMALAKFVGIDTEIFEKKIFGVFQTSNLNTQHKITGELDDIFWCPQSRHTGYSDEVMVREQKKGVINLLAYAPDGPGYTIFESADGRFLMHLGHPEYDPQRLIDEYNRDMALGRQDVDPPRNMDLDDPKNCWRGVRFEFFSQWIRFVHESIGD